MKITVEVLYNPDVSPWAFVSVSYKDGHAGKVERSFARCQAQGSHEELHEVVCQLIEKGLTTPGNGPWDQLTFV